MATTTPNFGWPVPTSTDLVKDGATAIEALGDSIDASLLDLKGGTTGQVLAKASGTDMDFSWVAQDDSNAIQNAIVDAKGDLIAASAADTPARLAVGNNGETLVADSSTSTGLRYTAGTVQANPVLNSAMQIAQRGTSFATTSAGYTLDRWYAAAASAGTVSRQVTNDTTNLPFIQYCARFARTAASSSTTALELSQSLETVNSIPFAGKTVTYSFYARAGANYSPTSGNLQVILKTGTGTDQNTSTGYTGSVLANNSNVVLTTTWQRFSVTQTLATNATEIGLMLIANVTGTAGANDYFEVTGVQLDIGSVALPFRTYAGTIQGELAACRRYLPAIVTGSNTTTLVGMSNSTTSNYVWVPFDVPARVNPTGITRSALSTFTVFNGSIASGTPTAVNFDAASLYGGFINIQHTAGSPTTVAGNAMLFRADNTASILFTGCEL
jgi:hypothetical protein